MFCSLRGRENVVNGCAEFSPSIRFSIAENDNPSILHRPNDLLPQFVNRLSQYFNMIRQLPDGKIQVLNAGFGDVFGCRQSSQGKVLDV